MRIFLSGKMVRTIGLSQGFEAIVDDDQFEALAVYRWRAKAVKNGTVYAIRTSSRREGKRRTIYMHRVVAGASGGGDVDHINRNGLDNRRENLRSASRSQNSANSMRRRNNNSGYKGVYWNKQSKKWEAGIKQDGVSHYLGQFSDALSSAHAYDAAARTLFGEFAHTNGGK